MNQILCNFHKGEEMQWCLGIGYYQKLGNRFLGGVRCRNASNDHLVGCTSKAAACKR